MYVLLSYESAAEFPCLEEKQVKCNDGRTCADMTKVCDGQSNCSLSELPSVSLAACRKYYECTYYTYSIVTIRKSYYSFAQDANRGYVFFSMKRRYICAQDDMCMVGNTEQYLFTNAMLSLLRRTSKLVLGIVHHMSQLVAYKSLEIFR